MFNRFRYVFVHRHIFRTSERFVSMHTQVTFFFRFRREDDPQQKCVFVFSTLLFFRFRFRSPPQNGPRRKIKRQRFWCPLRVSSSLVIINNPILSFSLRLRLPQLLPSPRLLLLRPILLHTTSTSTTINITIIATTPLPLPLPLPLLLLRF